MVSGSANGNMQVRKGKGRQIRHGLPYIELRFIGVCRKERPDHFSEISVRSGTNEKSAEL